MALRITLALIGIFNVGNGVYMLVAPQAWYGAVPGVAASGPMNTHFIVDVGFAFIASGAGQLLGLKASRAGAAFALAGSVWPALHAAFHVWGWLTHGLPGEPAALWSEVAGVVLVAAVGLVLAAQVFVRGGKAL
jgi:hypothetical protein